MPQNGTQIIAVINPDANLLNAINNCQWEGLEKATFKTGNELFYFWQNNNSNIKAIISCSEVMGPYGLSLFKTLQEKKFPTVPFIICAKRTTDALNKILIEAGIADIFTTTPSKEILETRIPFLINNWQKISSQRGANTYKEKKASTAKRMFDIVFASLAILCLSPILLLVILAIKLESKGPVFYYSLRVGRGYKIFRFYKFRSMYVNADQKLKDLKHLNQYTTADKKEDVAVGTTDSFMRRCNECRANNMECQYLMYADNIQWCEKNYIVYKKTSEDSAFIKIVNDPRITKVGNIIRNASIDELPQLWNVIKGDMSIVGNRPLPLYEAERLTTDKYALRFLAPAGITGLWQVEKRGSKEMSEEERLMLDNNYAANNNFFSDIKLILKTIPALFQKENV